MTIPDLGLVATERVVIRTREPAYDDLREPIGETVTETPVDAVVCPGATSDLDATRPDGVTVSYTVHLPKGWAVPLRGAEAVVRGETFRVVGDPMPYAPANVPGAYSTPVEVTRADG